MRKVLYLIVVFAAIAAIAGCVTVKKAVRERVDQDVSGNRGYIQGRAPEGPSAAKSRTREYIDVKVEIPAWGEFTGAQKPEEKPRKITPAEEELEEYGVMEEDIATMPAPVHIEEPAEEIKAPAAVRKLKPATYKVQEGDTLGHIAKKFYNKASKWTLIYEANMDKIKDPKSIKPGTELVIPELGEESKYIK